MVLDLESMTPRYILKGSRDWVFVSKFLSRNQVLTASRDSTVRLYNISEKRNYGGKVMVSFHLNRYSRLLKEKYQEVCRNEHGKEKVRCLSVSEDVCNFGEIILQNIRSLSQLQHLDLQEELIFGQKIL